MVELFYAGLALFVIGVNVHLYYELVEDPQLLVTGVIGWAMMFVGGVLLIMYVAEPAVIVSSSAPF